MGETHETHRCPRRDEVGAYPFAAGWPTEDTWRDGTSFASAPREAGGVRLRSCSWCGSIHPDDFLALAEQGYVVGPTDKNYKVYLEGPPPPLDERLARAKRAGIYKALVESADQEEADKWAEREANGLMAHGASIGKFYTPHLSPEQGDRFRALLEGGKMVVGYPGYFYARIYVPKTEPTTTPKTETDDGEPAAG